MQKKTQAAAEEKISEAATRVTAMAGGLTSKATGQWGKLEDIFEERVAKALNKLGVPSAKDVNALIARIDALNASVQALSAKAASASKAAPAKAYNIRWIGVRDTTTSGAVPRQSCCRYNLAVRFDLAPQLP